MTKLLINLWVQWCLNFTNRLIGSEISEFHQLIGAQNQRCLNFTNRLMGSTISEFHQWLAFFVYWFLIKQTIIDTWWEISLLNGFTQKTCLKIDHPLTCCESEMTYFGSTSGRNILLTQVRILPGLINLPSSFKIL